MTNISWGEIIRTVLAIMIAVVGGWTYVDGRFDVVTALAQDVSRRVGILEITTKQHENVKGHTSTAEAVEKLRLDQALTRSKVDQVDETVQENKALLKDIVRELRNQRR